MVAKLDVNVINPDKIKITKYRDGERGDWRRNKNNFSVNRNHLNLRVKK